MQTFFLAFGILIGTFIGYMLASLRIRMYLKKYYPDVNFQQSRKERKEILEQEATNNEKE
jgi:hypothetical protein